MRPEELVERTLDVTGWPIRITSYRIGDRWHAKVDNVSPGAWFARATAATRAQAEEQAIDKARARLDRTRRIPV